MADTIFDKIVRGEIPNSTVYEDDHVLAFLDIYPIAKGHTVVILKHGQPSVLDYQPADLQVLMEGVQKTMKRIQEVLSPDSFNIGINDGPEAGQAIPYLHVHVIPRWSADGGGNIHSIIKNPGNESVEEISKKFT